MKDTIRKALKTLGIGIGFILMFVIAVGIFTSSPPTEEATETTIEASTTIAPSTTIAQTTTTRRATTTTAYELSDSDLETIYLITLQEWTRGKPFNLVDTASDSELIELGRLTCSSLDNGATFYEIASALLGAVGGENVEAAGAVVGAAVGAFCPEYQAQMDAFVESTR